MVSLGVNNQIQYTWDSFLDAQSLRFDKSIYHDPKAAFREPKQVNSISEHQFQFEELSNQVTGLSEEWLISLFIAGLQEHLKGELMLAKPETYVAAVLMARLHEQKHTTLHQAPKFSGGRLGMQSERRFSNYSSTFNRAVMPRLVSPMVRPSQTQNSLQSPQMNSLQASAMAGSPQFRRLTSTKIKQKWEKGL